MYHNRYQPAGLYAEAGLLDKHFRKIKFLGSGSFGKVYQVERKSDGQVYALKELDVRSMKQNERKDAINEARFLASVQHINVLSYKEAFIDGNKLCIVMEYAPYGDLHQLLRQREIRRTPLSETQIWRFFIQALQGVAALHELGVLHRDIKPLNIMVTDTDIVKVGDLGIARRLVGAAGEKMARTQIGTPHYMAPEIWRGSSYGLSTDMWALGCLLFQLATLKVPFDARDMSTLKTKIMRNQHSPIPATCPTDVTRVIRQLLVLSPSSRPTAQQLLSNPTIQRHMSTLPSSVRDAPSQCGELLATINVPYNLSQLQGRLPPANYDDQAGPAGRSKSNPPLRRVAEHGDSKGEKENLPPAARPAKQPSQPGVNAIHKVKEEKLVPANAFDKKVREAMEKQKEAGAEAKVVVGSKAHRVPAKDMPPSQPQKQSNITPPFGVDRAPSPALKGQLGNRLNPSPLRNHSPNVALNASPPQKAAQPQPTDLPYLSPALARLRQRVEDDNKAAGSPYKAGNKTPGKQQQGKAAKEGGKKPSVADKPARKPGQDQKQLYKIYGGAGVDRLGKKKVGADKVDEQSPAAIYMRYKKQVQQSNWQYNVRPSWM